MRNNDLNFDAIQEEHLDELIRLAYLQDDALEAQDVLEDGLRELSPEEEALCERAYARFREQAERLDRDARRQDGARRRRRWFSRAGLAAACLIILLGIAAPIAIAKVDFIRVRVLKLLINVEEEYTELSLVEDDEASFNVPAEWRGAYYPSYIPEGYYLWYLDDVDDQVIYHHPDDEYGIVEFDEMSRDTKMNVDSEDAEISYDAVNGNSALVIKKGDKSFVNIYGEDDFVPGDVMVIWSNDEKYFLVRVRSSREEALRIARSVRRLG